ncbi:MAG TPA: DUF4982 domain-containing protein, partial [Flavisolibacter sp.]
MGTTAGHLNDVKRMIIRDRNHPSIISWSIGNEEWGIENGITGERIAITMQAFVKSFDTTRTTTAGISGGFRSGISDVLEVVGYNYLGNGDIDAHYKRFPDQPGMATEEGSTFATRGIYVTDDSKHYQAAYDKKPRPSFYSIEEAWKFYAARPYLAGMFIWTGFDYRGEPTPYGWPSVTSYFGMMDLCGFPKDNVYYLRSWWGDKPVLHLLPHWNWPGKEGAEIAVWAYSNCDEVELFLNKKSLGKKKMEQYGHLEWKVPYAPGTLEAVGYKGGKKALTDKVQTTGNAAAIQLTANQSSLKADKEDIAVVTVDMLDKNNLHIPTANEEIRFSIQGPAKIIGIGNGDPTSLEAEKYLPAISTIKIENLKEKTVETITNREETAAAFDDAAWQTAFKDERTQAFGESVKALVYRGSFTMPELKGEETVTFFYKSIGKEQSIYINGKEVGLNLKEEARGNAFVLPASLLRKGQNTIAIAAVPLLKKQPWDNINSDPGLFQIITPAPQWKRKLFNGWGQVIIQSTGSEGEIILTATSGNLKAGTLKLRAEKASLRPAITED